MFYKTVLLKNFGKQELTGKHLRQRFFLEKAAHHQACDFIWNRLQRRCFTLNFAKLLKSLKRTSPVNASNFNSNFLTLRPCKKYICVFPALLFFIFLSHFMFLIEARNKFIWFYTKFSVKQALFLTFYCTSLQTSTAKLPEFFSKILNRSDRSKG